MEVNRLSYLDNLRFSLVALVICHHANAAYGSIGGWSYVVREPGGIVSDVLANMFAGITQAFFMSSFFLISAYFTAPAFDKKGSWPFARRRLIRLGIPLLVYFYVLSLVFRYFVFRFQGRGESGFLEFFAAHFPHGAFGPLWFTFTLLIFEGVYIAYRSAADRFGLKPRAYPLPGDRHILLFILGIGLFTFFWRIGHPLNSFIWQLRLAFYPLYVSFFIFGLISYRSGWFTQLTAKQANRWFNVSLVGIAMMPALMVLNAALGYNEQKFGGGINWQSYVYAAWEPFLCVGINMKLIVWFRDRFNFSNAFTKRMGASSYTAYIVHAFFVVFATYLFTFFSLGRLPEILLMWPVAIISCFLFADIVRRAPLLNKVL
ncbi:MAG: acyltransferase family protein [Candidatus Hydrogenedentes bacterium]|nr:acyltransferase family protein [Candidatus Hydrogenedentota bacterium]